MKDDDVKLVRGSANVFRDFGDPNPDLEQSRAVLAAKIIKVLDECKLSVRAAEKLTGVGAAEFSRIRNVKLERFTIDRMITILGKLGQDVEIVVKVHPRRKRAEHDAPRVTWGSRSAETPHALILATSASETSKLA